MSTLATLPWATAHRYPEGLALRAGRYSLTFRQLDSAAATLAGVLHRHGVAAADRVAVLCGNDLAFPVAYYGVLRLGAVVAPLSTASPPAEVATSLRRLRPRAIVCDTAHAATAAAAQRVARSPCPLLRLAVEATPGALAIDTLVGPRAPDPPLLPPQAPAVILTTSGTTGRPRHVVHSHLALYLNARMVAVEMLGLSPRDRQLGILPLAHSFGMSAVLNASVLVGAGIVVASPDVTVARRLLETEGVTVLQGVPTLLRRLAETSPAPPASLRLAVVSGSPLPRTTAAAITSRLCSTLVERYGMTEASPLTMRRVPADGGLEGDVGEPLAGVVVRVGDGGSLGELEVSAPTMFLGYFGDRRGTAAVLRGGFLRTGDVGRVEPDGRVVVVGRTRDIILRGGNTVAAREVEVVLESHPGVAEVAVVGVADADLGEEVAAMVVARRGRRLDPADLERHCAERLARFKCPRRWLVVDALPRTASGKVRKVAVRDRFLEKH